MISDTIMKHTVVILLFNLYDNSLISNDNVNTILISIKLCSRYVPFLEKNVMPFGFAQV